MSIARNQLCAQLCSRESFRETKKRAKSQLLFVAAAANGQVAVGSFELLEKQQQVLFQATHLALGAK